MADEVDRANELVQRWLDAAIAQKKPVGPAPTGEYLWCGEPLPDGRRWCGPACRDAWEAAGD